MQINIWLCGGVCQKVQQAFQFKKISANYFMVEALKG